MTTTQTQRTANTAPSVLYKDSDSTETYTHVSCHTTHVPHRFCRTNQEYFVGRWMMTAIIFGGLIHRLETTARRSTCRPYEHHVPIVSLGYHASLLHLLPPSRFSSRPMTWDATRDFPPQTPSGVGFLGLPGFYSYECGEKNEFLEMCVERTVHGSTTAIFVWSSAVVGIVCGEDSCILRLCIAVGG